MVLVTHKSVSDEFITVTTKDVPVVAANMAASLIEKCPIVSSAVAMTAPTVAMVAEPTVAFVTATKTTAVSRGKLYELLKVAIATGVGLVLGAGVVYIYMRSYSNIGKDINAVAQSVNSLKG